MASDLRQRADAVAAALDAGDGCAARARARGLVHAVAQAVNRRTIPKSLLEPLTSSANELVARITCTPPPSLPPTVSEPPPPHGHGKAKSKHKHHGHGEHGGGGDG